MDSLNGTAPLLSVAGLTKRFGDFTSVDAVTFEVKPGEVFGILGLNGAGKTTTIKMLNGLLTPSAGTATICGHDVGRNSLEARRVTGYVPDNPFLYERLTGGEFLEFVADLWDVPREGRAERVAILLGLFQLEEKINSLIMGYSRGMRQKLTLAAALLHSPKVLFLDEPTVGLDPLSARTMEDVIRWLARRGAAVCISTHVLAAAQRICDRIAIMHHGRIVAQGTLAELQEAAGIDARNAPSDLESVFFRLTGGHSEQDVFALLDETANLETN